MFQSLYKSPRFSHEVDGNTFETNDIRDILIGWALQDKTLTCISHNYFIFVLLRKSSLKRTSNLWMWREIGSCFNLVESGFQLGKINWKQLLLKGYLKIFQRKVKTMTGELEKMLSGERQDLLSLCLTKKGKKGVDYMCLIPNLKRLLKLSEEVP